LGFLVEEVMEVLGELGWFTRETFFQKCYVTTNKDERNLFVFNFLHDLLEVELALKKAIDKKKIIAFSKQPKR